MMRHARRASVLVAFFLLASAAMALPDTVDPRGVSGR